MDTTPRNSSFILPYKNAHVLAWNKSRGLWERCYGSGVIDDPVYWPFWIPMLPSPVEEPCTCSHDCEDHNCHCECHENECSCVEQQGEDADA